MIPIVLAVTVAQPLTAVLVSALGLSDPNWWVRTGLFLAVYLMLFAMFVTITALVYCDYWNVWKLEPVVR